MRPINEIACAGSRREEGGGAFRSMAARSVTTGEIGEFYVSSIRSIPLLCWVRETYVLSLRIATRVEAPIRLSPKERDE